MQYGCAWQNQHTGRKWADKKVPAQVEMEPHWSSKHPKDRYIRTVSSTSLSPCLPASVWSMLLCREGPLIRLFKTGKSQRPFASLNSLLSLPVFSPLKSVAILFPLVFSVVISKKMTAIDFYLQNISIPSNFLMRELTVFSSFHPFSSTLWNFLSSSVFSLSIRGVLKHLYHQEWLWVVRRLGLPSAV